MRPLFRSGVITVLLAIVAGLVGCSSAPATSSSPSAEPSQAGAWPRTITHPLGTTTITAKPTKIVSTSVVLTGTLLALDAPVVGSGASVPNTGGADTGLDSDGFFAHWGDIARERGVKPLYKNSELDLEAVIAAAPDLIVISATGGDSTAEQYAELAKVAPTVAVDYNSLSWQETTKAVAEATGTDASTLLTEFDTKMATLKASTKPPAEAVQMIVFNESNGSAFALANGPHDQIISALGFTLAPLPSGVQADPKRKDFAFASEEQSVAGLTADTVLLVDGDEATVAAIKKHPAYSKVKAATSGTLVPLGHASFKLDYYSAIDMAERLARAFA
ncbi:MAG: Fe2+-enterobactin ABC transporter substrate-binding protein [Micropruina sp.]|uniref:Fe2+-enterobactin ABC transporter substrate-binding protein n=1 Tax=Micropruina sp. TaxID=2737536 RepID=UPI0039E4F067